MIASSITLTTWLVWAVIGIVAGYMTGRLINDGRFTSLNVTIGVIGALIGGWLFVHFMGASENMQILSLVTALIASGIFLWILTLITGRYRSDD